MSADVNRFFTIELSASVGDRYLGLYPVEGTDIIASCAEVGAKIQSKLVSQEWIDGANAPVEDYLDEELHDSDFGYIQSASEYCSDETVSTRYGGV